MKYLDGVSILDESMYNQIYIEKPTGNIIFSDEIRVYQHPKKEIFVVIQEHKEKLHFIKAYATVHSESSLVTRTYYYNIVTHTYDNGQYHGIAVLMDGNLDCNVNKFLDFIDKNLDQFEPKMHSLPVIYLQLTAGSNTKKQETILTNLGLNSKGREFYFSIPHILSEEKLKQNVVNYDLEQE